MNEPRFVVCTVGDDGFSVKDRKTNRALGYYRTQAEAEKARDAFNRCIRKSQVACSDRSSAGRADG
jgi:hypothetical protein